MREATVCAVGDAGEVTVRHDDGAESLCRLLQMSEDRPLQAVEGDRVLVVAPTGADEGYVLGRVGLPRAPAGPATRVVEVVIPEGVETVRIAGRKVTIAADESLSLECGGGSIRIDKRGKVVVLGTDITSRAKRLHKVKGASVAIN
ncbi:hypothetical protein B1759_08775 [Rubrivirga sp. SAORIC476]|nr:hypothetical protein B1759_08775 [Rubrivirga sp. SAORIC476]